MISRSSSADRLALSSVWANKMRSFMMVLGNIVAVTSIIAVVSLIQGMDTYVADAILKDVGAGTFKVEKVGFITDEEEERHGLAPQPEHHDARRKADRDVRPPIIDAVMAESGANANITYGDVMLESTRVRGVSAELRGVQRLLRRASAGCRAGWRSTAARPVVLLGWDTADKLFKGRNPIDKVIQINGMHFRVLGVSEKKGSVFGNSQDEFVLMPLGAFQRLFGSRRSLEITVKPAQPDDRSTRRWTRRAWRCA